MKKILLILASLVVVVLIAAAVMPKDFKIEQEIVINKPKSEVFDYLRMVKNENIWSPWAKKDPNIVQDYKGEDGTVGFVVSWSGNSAVGVGEEEITNIVNNERIDLELRFQKPMKTTNKAYFITEDINNNQTKVTWGMEGRTPYPLNIICFFMQKEVKKEFASGLNNLKKILEK
jgi:hypothetical protein